MAADMDNSTGIGNHHKISMTAYLVLGIAVVLFAIIITFLFKSGSNSNSSIVTDSVNESNTSIVEVANQLKPVESFDSVLSSCKDYASSNDAKSYCTNFRKVDFDGLQVFINCDYADIRNSISNPLSCSDYPTDVKSVCQEMNLNPDEFVSVDGRVNTCAEASLA